MENNKVLFSLWTNLMYDEPDMEKMKQLIHRADTIVRECFVGEESSAGEFEDELNAYARTGRASQGISFLLDFTEGIHKPLLRMIGGCGKSIVVEKAEPIPPENSGGYEFIDAALKTDRLEDAVVFAESCMARTEPYLARKEARFAAQVLSLNGNVLVTCGADYPGLVGKVAEKRPVEVHYPHQEYDEPYMAKLRLQFRSTGRLDQETYLRTVMEHVVNASLPENIKGVTRFLVTRFYADALTPEQMSGYLRYAGSCSRLLCVPNDSVLDSYMKKESLPEISEVKEMMRVKIE